MNKILKRVIVASTTAAAGYVAMYGAEQAAKRHFDPDKAKSQLRQDRRMLITKGFALAVGTKVAKTVHRLGCSLLDSI